MHTQTYSLTYHNIDLNAIKRIDVICKQLKASMFMTIKYSKPNQFVHITHKLTYLYKVIVHTVCIDAHPIAHVVPYVVM